MKIKLLCLSLVLLATGGSSLAQIGNVSNPLVGNLNVQDTGTCTTTGSIVQQLPPNASTTTLTLAGTFSATITVRTSNNGTNWTTANTLSAAGTTSYSTNGLSHLCVDVTAYTSGVVQVTILTGLLQVQSVVSGSGSGSWLGLTAGVNVNTGLFQSIQPGNFTSGAHHQVHQRILDGGSATGDTCPGNYNIGGATAVTDAFSACNYTPASGVANSFNNALAGYVQVNDPNQGGQFGKIIGVGVYAVCTAAANNTKCIGAAPQVEDKVGETGTLLESMELGISPFNTTTQGQGLLLSTEGATVQPAGNQMPAVEVQTPSSTSTFTTGFQCDDGATSSGGSFTCLRIGKRATGNGQDSQQLIFTATNSGGGNVTANLNYAQDNIHGLSSQGWNIYNPTGVEAYGISLTATAALSTNQLVKIDTANAHSVVVCTTADTQCDGFVIGTNYLCGAAGSFCEIATAPGLKVFGILGTGTCAIGNFVLVDTTTNGRIKCQAGIPAQGAVIGKALSAQASVGSTVEILTKFQ